MHCTSSSPHFTPVKRFGYPRDSWPLRTRRLPRMMCSRFPLDMFPFQRRSPIQRFWARRWGQLSVICPIPIPMPLQFFAHKLDPQMIFPGQPVPELEKYMDSIVAKQAKINTMVETIKDKVSTSAKSEECKPQMKFPYIIYIYTNQITYFWASKSQPHSWDLTWIPVP